MQDPLILDLIKKPADAMYRLRILGNELKKLATDDPVMDSPTYAVDEKDLAEQIEEMKNDPKAHDACRALVINGHFVTLSLTFDKYKERDHFHISFVEHIRDSVTYPGEKGRVPDNVSEFLCKGILGDEAEEIAQSAEGQVAMKNVRHFIRRMEG